MLVGRFETPRQVPHGLDVLFHRMVFPLRSAGEIPPEWRGKTMLEIPRGNFGSSDKLRTAVNAARAAGFTRFEVTNIGHLQLLGALGGTEKNTAEELDIWAGWSMNILNPLAAAELAALGVNTQTVSCEAQLAELPLFKAAGIRTAVLAYGRLPVMLTRSCPLHNVTDCEKCPKRGRLLDRKGEQLPVVCRGSVREIFNPIPLWLGDRQDEADCDLLTLYFTWESPERVRAVTELFRAGAPFDGRFTRGLYYSAPDGT
jgi:putative protease